MIAIVPPMSQVEIRFFVTLLWILRTELTNAIKAKMGLYTNSPSPPAQKKSQANNIGISSETANSKQRIVRQREPAERPIETFPGVCYETS